MGGASTPTGVVEETRDRSASSDVEVEVEAERVKVLLRRGAKGTKESHEVKKRSVRSEIRKRLRIALERESKAKWFLESVPAVKFRALILDS